MTDVHVIVEVDKGLHEETPRVFNDEQLAGEYFERRVTAKGFRKKAEDDSWISYHYDFMAWEDSPECTYDKADWEIHWWNEVPVNFDPHNVEEQEEGEDEKVVIEESDGLFSIYNEAGQSIEVDFETRLDAEVWAEDNGYEVVDSYTPVHSTRQDFGEPWQDPQPNKEF